MDYIFYTEEGYCESPKNSQVENFQVLGFTKGKTLDIAYENLLAENEWILEEHFSEEKVYYKPLLTPEISQDIQMIIRYLWKDEKRHYEEGKTNDHIFLCLKRLRDYFNINIK